MYRHVLITRAKEEKEEQKPSDETVDVVGVEEKDKEENTTTGEANDGQKDVNNVVEEQKQHVYNDLIQFYNIVRFILLLVQMLIN